MSSTVVLIDLLGAAALLVCGLRFLKTGVMRAFGASLRLFLASSTSNRFLAFGVGLLTTLALQSSTATAVMTGSFVAQGLVDLAMAQAMMLGANVGTSLVTQILSLDLHWLAGICLIAAVMVGPSGGSTRSNGIGKSLLGLGLMLLSLKLMNEATGPLRDSEAVRALLAMLGNAPVIAVAASAFLAAASASSLAVVLFVMSLADAGIADPALCLLLVAGANLGGAIPPVFAVAGDGAEARQVTLANLGVRTLGSLLVILTLPRLSELLTHYAEPQRLVVDAHVGFNLLLAVLFLPFVRSIAWLTVRMLPSATAPENGPRHLDEAALSNPTAALAGAMRETMRIGDIVESMLEASLGSLSRGDEKLCKAIAVMDDKVDRLQEAVKLYVSRLRAGPLDEAQARQADAIMTYAINLEHIGDILDKNLARLALKKIQQQAPFSEEGFRELERLYRQTIANLQLAQTVFLARDRNLARQLIEEKVEIRRTERASCESHLRRVQEGRVESIQTSSLHLDVLRDLKRINAHIASVAYPILDELGELRESRLRQVG